jgi:2-succinyl-6-hydroxy-2,4-cyclohexadiene-1-carboxylate synthase
MQRGDAWQGVADLVGERYRSICLDPVSATLEERIAEIRAARGKGAILAGYSMGGRLALHALLREPGRYSGLITVGAHAGLEDKGDRASRRVADAEFAAWIERSPVSAIVKRWEEQPLFKTQAGDLREAQRPGRVSHDPAQLASILRTCGQGAMAPAWDRLGEIQVPTLHLAGELDEQYVAAAERMAALISNSRWATVPGVGHAAHLEAPRQVATLLLEFLDQNFGQRGGR